MRSHMNFCIECNNAFTLDESKHPDLCEKCRVALDIQPYDYEDSVIETEPAENWSRLLYKQSLWN